MQLFSRKFRAVKVEFPVYKASLSQAKKKIKNNRKITQKIGLKCIRICFRSNYSVRIERLIVCCFCSFHRDPDLLFQCYSNLLAVYMTSYF